VPRIVVIGAGVIGASVAFRLAEAGADVTVLEAGRPGGGTSGTSFAWLNAHNKPPRPYHDLNVAGMRAHAALARELGAAPWLHGGGSLEWVSPDRRAAQAANVERLRAWGYAAEWITRAEALELEPDIAAEAIGDAPVAFFPEEGWLDPVSYVHAMLRLALRQGANVLAGQPVREVILRAGRADRVRTADGSQFAADVVVNCAGRWVNDPLPAELHVPMAPTRGLLVLTPPVASGLARVGHAPEVNARPDGAGRLMLIADHDEFGTDAPPDTAMPAARDLVRRVQALLPMIGAVEPEAARIGTRAIPRDGVSAVGELPGEAGLYVAVTHSGVTLAALIGRAVADEIMTRRARPELAPFRPARFFGQAASAA
jgi:glycine/D-amino acid oxidase-like deaminating enzyme